jgi:hypothetical protein
VTLSVISGDYGWGTAKIFLLDVDAQHANALANRLRSGRLHVDVSVDPDGAVAQLRRKDAEYEIVIVNISAPSFSWLKTLQKLNEVCRLSGARHQPLFLCVSTNQQQPEFVLQIERTGARYVRER